MYVNIDIALLTMLVTMLTTQFPANGALSEVIGK